MTANPAAVPLRLWPGVALVLLQWMIRIGVLMFAPEQVAYGIMGAIGLGIAVGIWWICFSRAPRVERFATVPVMALGLVATKLCVDKSIATGMMGLMLFIYAIPVLSLALVVWAAATRRLSTGVRRAWLVATILIACGVWTLVRTDGMTGDAASAFAWRWSATPEQKLLAQAVNEPPAPAPDVARAAKPEAAPAVVSEGVPEAAPTAPAVTAYWPGFRGPNRDSAITGVHIATNWAASPPVRLWSRPIGPGWSSFAVRGNMLYTQEQRGENELVVCYNATTGKPVWTHGDAVRFWESNAGAGPRGTPTLSGGRVYTFGATGLLNALDARTGAVVWSRNAAADAGSKLPGWGFASSPLVVDGMVIVAASGRLVAYDSVAGGVPRWLGRAGGVSYSSPQLVTIAGVPQVVLTNDRGVSGVAPSNGGQLWEYPMSPSGQIVQPARTADGDLLVSEGESTAMRRISIAKGADGWAVEERWRSIGLKPYFNDFVVHMGHAFGFDGSILACIDLNDGKRKWKGGRYGQGQLILLPDQDLLLVLSEQGELAVVKATPAEFKEVARMPAIEGKTWNHPVLAGGSLFVRNGEQMAAFRMDASSR